MNIYLIYMVNLIIYEYHFYNKIKKKFLDKYNFLYKLKI